METKPSTDLTVRVTRINHEHQKGFIKPKWADHLISKVQYNSDETHITNVFAYADHGETLGVGSIVSRKSEASGLGAGTTYMTVTMGEDNKFHKGAAVQVITIDSVKYIKTVPDSTKKDNLGSLPKF